MDGPHADFIDFLALFSLNHIYESFGNELSTIIIFFIAMRRGTNSVHLTIDLHFEPSLYRHLVFSRVPTQVSTSIYSPDRNYVPN